MCLSVCLSIHPSIYLSLSLCLSVYLPVYLQAWKRSYSARRPQVLNLTTSKTQQFCETSFKNGKLSAELTASYQCVLGFFQLSKLLRLPRKSDARSYEVLHLSRKIISANLKIWCSKMQSLSGNQRPDLQTALMKMSLVLRLPRKRHLCRSSANAPRLPWFLDSKNLTFCLLLPRCTIPCACHTKRHLNVQKWSEPLQHFDFEMCFAPQRRALFRHLNFSKSGPNP